MDINQEEWEARLGSDLSRVCRLCLKTSDAFHPIFSNSQIEQTLPHKIMSCAKVKVFEGDGLPTHICHTCYGQVERSYQFKLLCERSDGKLRGSIVNIRGSSDTDEMDDQEGVDMSQLTPEVIIDEELSNDNTPQFHVKKEQDDISKSTERSKNEHVYNRIMQNVLEQSSLLTRQLALPKPNQQSFGASKQPTFLKGLPGFVHSNQEMARMAVAMALHQKGIDQKKKDLEKQMELQLMKQRRILPEDSQTSSSSFNKSRRCRNGVKAFKCTQCNKSYSFSSALSRHKAVHNPHLRPHFCRICNKGFTQVEKLMRHQRTHALDSSVLPLAIDNRPSNLMRNYPFVHRFQMVPLPSVKPEEMEISIRPDIYPQSDDDYDDDEDEDEELETVSRENDKPQLRISRQIDLIKTSMSNSIDITEKSINGSKITTSQDCSNSTIGQTEETERKIDQNAKIERQANETKQVDLPTDKINKVNYPPPTGKGRAEFRCSVCLKCFATRGSLEVHSNIHTGVRPFVCKICQQSFRHKVNLIEHFQRKHSQVRPYHCDVCASRFVTKQELLRHYRKHVGE